MPHKDPEAARVYRRARYAANLERLRASKREEMRRSRSAKPQAAAYKTQKSHAKQRNIPFLLTFKEWWDIWRTSGKWEQRGRRRGQYCMARFGDQGAYAVGNVRICLTAENATEWASNITEETRQRMSETSTGRRHSEDTLARMSAAQFKRHQEKPHSAETRRKISETKKSRMAHHDTSGFQN